MPHLHRLGAICFALLATLITACGQADQLAQAAAAPATDPMLRSTKPSTETPSTINHKFVDLMRQVAGEYGSYTLVDRNGHWAPEQCYWAPSPEFSEATPDAPHAQKIYFLFVKEPDSYEAPEAAQPVGQAIVKQSWSPIEVATNEIEDSESDQSNRPVIPYASRDGKLYRGDHQTGLFIMLKLDPNTPGTGEGWIYGTVSPDRKEVTSAGRVEGCMECHQQAKGDRVFGIKRNDSPASSLDD